MKQIFRFDCFGNPVVLKENSIYFFRKENPVILFKIIKFPNKELAKETFAGYYKKPVPKRTRRPATVYYTQLIINC